MNDTKSLQGKISQYLQTCIPIVILIVILISGCQRVDEVQMSVPQNAKAGDLLNLETCTYETGEVTFTAECGTLIVPEIWADPNSRLISLPVMQIPSTSNDVTEPIFWLNGGPGQSNIRFSHPQDLEAFLENQDFILVGYRGVDGQVVLDCPEISAALSNPPGELLSDAALKNYSAAALQCASRLEAEGVDLAGYTMTETIHDIEAARTAFGYQKINLLGASYGSRLAMMYEWMYPQYLQRVIMIGVNPPGSFIWDADVIDAQIGDYALLCAEDHECSSRTNDLSKTMLEVSKKLPKRWLFFPIDPDKVKLITFIMFTESIRTPGDPVGIYGPAAIDMWQSAAEGDASGMALASLLSKGFLPNFYTWGHTLAMGGGTGEYTDPNRNYPVELYPEDSILGAPFSLLMWSMGEGWPAHPISEEYHQVQPSDVETLLESGNIDFMNPPQDGTQELLPYLSNGQQVILKDFGHGNTFWNSQTEARIHLLTNYFNTGEADTSLYIYQPLNFDVGKGWPGLAKTVFAIFSVSVVVLLTIVILIIVLIIRRIRTRNAQSHQH